jgi:hypothetical protein
VLSRQILPCVRRGRRHLQQVQQHSFVTSAAIHHFASCPCTAQLQQHELQTADQARPPHHTSQNACSVGRVSFSRANTLGNNAHERSQLALTCCRHTCFNWQHQHELLANLQAHQHASTTPNSKSVPPWETSHRSPAWAVIAPPRAVIPAPGAVTAPAAWWAVFAPAAWWAVIAPAWWAAVPAIAARAVVAPATWGAAAERKRQQLVVVYAAWTDGLCKLVWSLLQRLGAQRPACKSLMPVPRTMQVLLNCVQSSCCCQPVEHCCGLYVTQWQSACKLLPT